eukprot:sb/3472204/
MPWPFNDDDDGDDGRRGGFFGGRGDPFMKEFEDLFRMFDGMQPIGPSRSQPPVDQSAAKLQNPRAYFLLDPRHVKERNKGGGGGGGGLRDEEVDIRGDLGVLTRPPQAPQYGGGGGGVTRESTSYSQRWVNGSKVTEERRERVEGRTRTIITTRTDENGNTTTEQRTESI